MKLLKKMMLISIILFGMGNAYAQNQNPCGLVFQTSNCKEGTFIDRYCEGTPNSPWCTVSFKYCWGIINGQKSLYIEKFEVRPTNCPCEDRMRYYVLEDAFNNPDLQLTFGIAKPILEYSIEVYVANCVEKQYVP
jgi:hypothetical protein